MTAALGLKRAVRLNSWHSQRDAAGAVHNLVDKSKSSRLSVLRPTVDRPCGSADPENNAVLIPLKEAAATGKAEQRGSRNSEGHRLGHEPQRGGRHQPGGVGQGTAGWIA